MLVALDAFALALSWAILLVIQHASLLRGKWPEAGTLVFVVTVSVVGGLAMARHKHLYRSHVCNVKEHERSLLVWVASASTVLGAVAFRLLGISITALSLILTAICALVVLIIERSAYRTWQLSQHHRGRFTRPALIAGANEEGGYWARLFRQHPELGVVVKGVVDDDEASSDEVGVPWLGRCSDVVAVAADNDISTVIVVPTAFAAPALRQVVKTLLANDLHVQMSMGLLGLSCNRFSVTALSHENLVDLDQPIRSSYTHVFKRIVDVLGASLGIVLGAPLLALLALLIRLQDGGPVLFRQTRIGKGGKPFVLYKFRTMSCNADDAKSRLASNNVRDGPLFKVVRDPRVTRIGRFLRATSLDELPQLLNVFQGEMSLVGPRPALPEEVAQFDAELLSRHQVVPGITGLWQLEGRDNPSFESYYRLDLHYVENWSMLLDISILVSTFANIIGRSIRALTALHNGRSMPT